MLTNSGILLIVLLHTCQGVVKMFLRKNKQTTKFFAQLNLYHHGRRYLVFTQ